MFLVYHQGSGVTIKEGVTLPSIHVSWIGCTLLVPEVTPSSSFNQPIMQASILNLVPDGEEFFPDSGYGMMPRAAFRPCCQSPNLNESCPLPDCRKEDVMAFVVPFGHLPCVQDISSGLRAVHMTSDLRSVDVGEGGTLVNVTALVGLLLRGLLLADGGKTRAVVEFFKDGVEPSSKYVGMRILVNLRRRNPLYQRSGLAGFLSALEDVDLSQSESTSQGGESKTKKRRRGPTTGKRDMELGKECAMRLLRCCVVMEHVLLVLRHFWEERNVWDLFGTHGEALDQTILLIELLHRVVFSRSERRQGFMEYLNAAFFRSPHGAEFRTKSQLDHYLKQLMPFTFGETVVCPAQLIETRANTVVGIIDTWLRAMDTPINTDHDITRDDGLYTLCHSLVLTRSTTWPQSTFQLRRLGVPDDICPLVPGDVSRPYRRQPYSVGFRVEDALQLTLPNWMRSQIALDAFSYPDLVSRMVHVGLMSPTTPLCLSRGPLFAEYAVKYANHIYGGATGSAPADMIHHTLERQRCQFRTIYRNACSKVTQTHRIPNVFQTHERLDTLSFAAGDPGFYPKDNYTGAPSLITLQSWVRDTDTALDKIRHVYADVNDALQQVWNYASGGQSGMTVPTAYAAVSRWVQEQKDIHRTLVMQRRREASSSSVRRPRRLCQNPGASSAAGAGAGAGVMEDIGESDPVEGGELVDGSQFCDPLMQKPHAKGLSALQTWICLINEAMVDSGYKKIPHTVVTVLLSALTSFADVHSAEHQNLVGPSTSGKTENTKRVAEALIPGTCVTASMTGGSFHGGGESLSGSVVMMQEVGMGLMGASHAGHGADSDTASNAAQTFLEVLEGKFVRRQRTEPIDHGETTKTTRSKWGKVSTTTSAQYCVIATTNQISLLPAFAKRFHVLRTQKLTLDGSCRQISLPGNVTQLVRLVQSWSMYWSMLETGNVLPTTELGVARVVVQVYKDVLREMVTDAGIQDEAEHGVVEALRQARDPTADKGAPPSSTVEGDSYQAKRAQGVSDVDEIFGFRHETTFLTLVSQASLWERLLWLCGPLQPIFGDCTPAHFMVMASAFNIATVGTTLTLITTALPHPTSLHLNPTSNILRCMLRTVAHFSLGLLRCEYLGRWYYRNKRSTCVDEALRKKLARNTSSGHAQPPPPPPEEAKGIFMNYGFTRTRAPRRNTNEVNYGKPPRFDGRVRQRPDFFGTAAEPYHLPSYQTLLNAVRSGADQLAPDVAKALFNTPVDLDDPSYVPFMRMHIEIYNRCLPFLVATTNDASNTSAAREVALLGLCTREAVKCLVGLVTLGDVSGPQFFEEEDEDDDGQAATEEGLPDLTFHSKPDAPSLKRPLLIPGRFYQITRVGQLWKLTKRILEDPEAVEPENDTIYEYALRNVHPNADTELDTRDLVATLNAHASSAPSNPDDPSIQIRDVDLRKLQEAIVAMGKHSGGTKLYLHMVARTLRSWQDSRILVYHPESRAWTLRCSMASHHNQQIRKAVLQKTVERLSELPSRLQSHHEFYLSDPEEEEKYDLQAYRAPPPDRSLPCRVESSVSDMLTLHFRALRTDSSQAVLVDESGSSSVAEILLSKRKLVEEPVVAAARALILTHVKKWLEKKRPLADHSTPEFLARAAELAQDLERGLCEPGFQYTAYCHLMDLSPQHAAPDYSDRFVSGTQRVHTQTTNHVQETRSDQQAYADLLAFLSTSEHDAASLPERKQQSLSLRERLVDDITKEPDPLENRSVFLRMDEVSRSHRASLVLEEYDDPGIAELQCLSYRPPQRIPSRQSEQKIQARSPDGHTSSSDPAASPPVVEPSMCELLGLSIPQKRKDAPRDTTRPRKRLRVADDDESSGDEEDLVVTIK